MEKHLLLAVSDQKSAMHGVRFVEHFFSNKEDIKITLFFTAPRPLNDWDKDRDPDAVGQNKKLAMQYESRGRRAMEAARKDLIKTGFQDSNVNNKLQIRQISKVMDLIYEGEKGLYDAVILGRRGLSWLEEAFEDSVSKGLLDKKCQFPCWMCRGFDRDLQNVLVCADGSEAAYRMMDHVGFILEKEREQTVTLLLVTGKKEKDSVEEILYRSEENLTASGFPAELISRKTVVSNNAADAIIKVAREGRFAVVAMGRRSAEQGFLQKLFTGSVSSRLFRELEKASLWICH